MSIRISENSIAFWALKLNDTSDYLGHLEHEGDKIILTQRFRYYNPDDPYNEPFSEKDEKSWSAYEINETAEVALAKIRMVVRSLALLCGGNEPFEVVMGAGGIDQFVREMEACPALHLRTIPLKDLNIN